MKGSQEHDFMSTVKLNIPDIIWHLRASPLVLDISDYEALKRLHEKEIEKYGEDTLSVKDAYMEVFKQKSGYVKGLGPGAHPPKKCRAKGESNEATVSLSVEI
ncbi:Phosphoglucomutase [Bienertia sinuspersici]